MIFTGKDRICRPPSCDFVKETLENFYPPVGHKISQVVINKIAQADLLRKKGVESTVVSECI